MRSPDTKRHAMLSIAAALVPFSSSAASSTTRRFVSLHMLVPGAWVVRRGHDTCKKVELALRRALPGTTVFTHLEPREDPIAWADIELDRLPESAAANGR